MFLRIIIFTAHVTWKGGKRSFRPDMIGMTCNLQTKEMSKRNAGSLQARQVKQGREVNGRKPERPASALRQLPSQAVLGMPRRGITEVDSSICFSRDVGQCVISSNRWAGSEPLIIQRQKRQELNWRGLPWRLQQAPRTEIFVLFFTQLLTKKNALLSRSFLPLCDCPINWSCVSQHQKG